MRPENFLAALEAYPEDLAEGQWLRQAASTGLQYRRLPRLRGAEWAASGRARCRLCLDVVEKGQPRLALQLYEDGRFSPSGSIHVQCAQAYLGTAEILDRIQRLQELDPTLREQLTKQLRVQRPAPEEPAPNITNSDFGAAPGLVRTHASGEAPPARSRVR